MANINSVFGFRPVKGVGAGYTAIGSNEYSIASGESSAIFQGDPVVLNANGSISVGSTAGAELIGIFNGCFYDDPTTKKPTFSNFYPGGVTQTNMQAFVFDDPNMLFEAKIDDTNGGQAQVRSNANIATYAAGSTNNGVSGVSLDGSTFATSNAANFRVVSLSTDVDNNDYTAANASIIVKINKHSLTDTTGV